MLRTAMLLASVILGTSSEARAQAGDTLTYGCGRNPGITISVDPMAGKGVFADATAKGDFARAPLVPDQKGGWVNRRLGIMFFPEGGTPKVSAGDAEFTCRQKAAAVTQAPVTPPPATGSVVFYKCNTIAVTIDNAKGSGSYKDVTAPQFSDRLSRQADGTWRDKNEAVVFDPKASPPTVSAGDAEFRCRKTS
jgi:hypothetical protein